VPIAPQNPPPSPQIQFSTAPQQQRQAERDDRWWTIGVGPLLLGNIHWLDQPKDRNVTVGKANGSDDRYPGFVGSDFTVGLMVDVRFWHRIGVELDVFRQNDHGTGTITVADAGNICFIPGIAIPYPSQAYRVTIGQRAWHIPLMLKLSIPGRKILAREHEHGRDYDRGYRKWFMTLAFGPEFVFPGGAELEVSPDRGLGHPVRATVSTYLMATGALGFERRLTSSYDIRLLATLRGSYNPAAGSSAMKRGEYAIVDSQIVPLAYKSAWRYQAAMVVGVGWFF
jgi:hypothetical protein